MRKWLGWRWHVARVDFWWFVEHHGHRFGSYARRKQAERACIKNTGMNYYGEPFAWRGWE